MYKKLPECVVVLPRLTEEDLYKSYPSDSEDNYDINYDVKRKTDELCDTVEGMDASKRQDGSSRNVRRIPRHPAFELYKQKRERYMNRRNRAYHSENSLDMSQDDSRTFSDGAKPKKKLKRGRRYERDFEWRPDIPKGILNSDRKLRRRTSVIESDSSSSDDDDDEEFMYNLYMGYDDPYTNEETTSSNAVPSDDTNSTATTNNCELEKQPSDKYFSSHQNSSQSSASQNIDPGSFDIVSSIIKKMENQHQSKLKTSYNTSQHSNTKQSNDFIKTEQKKRKRPRMSPRKDKNSEIDPNKIVASILKEMVNKVSSKFKKCPGKQMNKATKICKWCTTPFQPNRSSDVKCAICTDLGNGEISKSLSLNKKSPNTLKIKCFKENKGKKTNSAKSKVLKNLSGCEKQRLMYSEKSDTKTSGKGYNHCKSFLTPKDITNKSESNVNLNASQNKTPNKLSLKEKKISSKLNQKINSDVNVNNNQCDNTQIKPIIRIKPSIHGNVEKPENKQNKSRDYKQSKNRDENKQSKSRVSLEKYNEGLFLMTFPDPDEEIEFDDKLSKSQVSKSGTSSESANKHINKQLTIESSSQSMKQSQSGSMKKYDTYLFPPIPTVIVSNYCSDTSSLNLSHTYFQNEITHQHAIKNSTTLSNTVNSNAVITLNNTVAPISNTVAYQNSSISTNFTSNNSTPINTFPFNTNNQISVKSVLNTEKPNTVNNMSILPKTSLPTGSLTMLPNTSISLSNVTISNLLSKTSVSTGNLTVLPKMSISANNVTILPKPSNSVTILPKPSVPSSSVTMLPIVTSVISLSDKNSGYKVKENLPSNFSSDNFVNSFLSEIKINNVTSLKDDQSLLDSEPTTHKDINKRLPSDSDTDENTSFENKSHSSAKRKKLNSDRFSSDYSEPADREDITNKSIEKEKDNSSNNQPSDSPEKEKSTQSNNDKKEQETSGSKESDKSSDDKEKTTPQSAISVTQSAIDLLGAISILAVIDLEQNPQKGLNVRIQVAKSQLNKLTNEKITTPEHNERIASCQYNLTLLNIAKKYLSIYGTFAKVSDHLLRKANMANMIQIKKELHEEETNQSSCMFSQPTPLNSSFSDRQSDMSRTVAMSPVNNQMQNFASSRTAVQTPINHIEKLKSQIAAMNNVNMNNVDLSQYGIFPGGGTIHHYPVDQIAALNHAVAAPAPITPRNDCLGNEARETPSRGSGPRTPARPESAASQSEDTAALIQIKKEQFETTTSPSSQCAYAQNTPLPQISSQLPVMPEMQTLMPQHSIPNTPMHLPVSNANQAYTNQTNYSVHSSGMAPNRTVAYTHQNYSDMYLNVTSKPQMQITPATTNAEMRQNQQMLLGQQMYIQNGSGLCSKQAVPSVNNNQYVIRPPYTTANIGGTLIVNNTQVGQNALLTNVSNQQFYTSNQVSQLYYPPQAQMTCMPNNNMPTMITQDVTAAQVQVNIFIFINKLIIFSNELYVFIKLRVGGEVDSA